jgi:hypothetical protein
MLIKYQGDQVPSLPTSWLLFDRWALRSGPPPHATQSRQSAEVASTSAAADAGAGDEHVHRAQALRQQGDGRTHLLALADVGGGQGHAHASSLQFTAEALQTGLVSIDQPQAGAGGAQLTAQGLTDAAGGPRHQDDAISKVHTLAFPGPAKVEPIPNAGPILPFAPRSEQRQVPGTSR